MPGSIHELFDAQAARTPDAVAIVHADHGQSLTFGELRARANQLAHALRAAGVGPDVLVGLCVERSLDMVVGALGILKAGGAYVPLDPAYPAERLAYMLAEVRAPVVVSQQALRDVLPAGTRVVCLDTDAPAIASQRTDDPPANATTRDLAYVVFTSGSTGKPKGVLLEHRGLCNTVLAQIEAFEIRPDSHVLQFASFSFDASVSEIFTSLVAGATLYVASQASLLPGQRFAQLLRDRGITIVTLPPSVLAIVSPHDAPGLRTVVSAGEACSAELVARWAPGRRFLNAYGPSEATICATIGVCRDATRRPSIGAPMNGCDVRILDAQRRPVAPGAEGEIYIGGAGVARGYLDRPELTAERFVELDGARFYRTGDLAKALPDGELDFLGRVDDQVKLRGYRIELGEIEHVLRGQPGVRDVAVIVREDLPGDKRLVAYVVADPAIRLTVSGLRDAAKRTLPEHMIPSAFAFLPALPVTPNGKVDRRALPAPGQARPALDNVYMAPTSALEIQLVELWETTLGVHPIGVTDDFFELGGQSLAAIALTERIEQLAGVALSPRTLFGARTIARLIPLVRGEAAPSSDHRLVAIQPKGTRRPLFLPHPVTGNVLCYAELVRCLGLDQPCYGLQTPALEGDVAVHPDLDAMAADYIDAIRRIQPRGPYLLAGWSVGGTIAFEMARQLCAAGERVALLALIEAWSPNPEMKKQSQGLDDARISFLFTKNLGRCAGQDLPIELAEFQGVDREEAQRRAWARVRQIDEGHEALTFARYQLLWDIFKRNLLAYASYERRVSPARITSFEVSEAAPGHPRPATLGWDDFTTDPIEHVAIPGNHFTSVYPPHVRVLAEQLRARIAAATAPDA